MLERQSGVYFLLNIVSDIFSKSEINNDTQYMLRYDMKIGMSNSCLLKRLNNYSGYLSSTNELPFIIAIFICPQAKKLEQFLQKICKEQDYVTNFSKNEWFSVSKFEDIYVLKNTLIQEIKKKNNLNYKDSFFYVDC